MEFSQIVKSLRLERGWSQQEVADRAGLNKMTISQYENGKRKPSFEVIEALAEIFHVDMNYPLGYTDKIEKPAGDETDPAAEYDRPKQGEIGKTTDCADRFDFYRFKGFAAIKYHFV